MVYLTISFLLLQWVNVPLPNIPRTADGKPNLSAPTPKTADGKPDLTGIWRNPEGRYLDNIAWKGIEVPFQPAAAALYKQRQETMSKDRPSGRCLPHGIPDAMLVPATPFKLIQTPSVTLILFENQGRFRQVFTDGRDLPQEMEPTWLGYSVGRWEGDTFVVDSKGFNDKTWLDDGGHPHTDAYHAIERFHRRDFGHLDVEMSFDDPQMYSKPFTVKIPHDLLPDADIFEMFCENEKDRDHLKKK